MAMITVIDTGGRFPAATAKLVCQANLNTMADDCHVAGGRFQPHAGNEMIRETSCDAAGGASAADREAGIARLPTANEVMKHFGARDLGTAQDGRRTGPAIDLARIAATCQTGLG